MEFKDYIRDIADFPDKGIVFKDISPLLSHPRALAAAADALLAMIDGPPIDKVVGVESRGFFFAPILAARLNAGFVPVRKMGKLPYATRSVAYDLEYGKDTLELHVDAIAPGENVLVHDDVLATGGTAKAVCELVEQSGGKVVQCNFLIQLDFLNGRAKLNDYTIKALMSY